MAKKTKKKDAELAEENGQLTVSQLDVTNRDVKSINIEKLIRIIRGQKVMLDSDLAMLYGVENKRLNEQVKRNINRFPEDFMFQLETKEWNLLRSQIATTKHVDNEPINNLKSQIATSSWGGSRKRPFTFTRNGIGMLSSVLRSETAVEVNIRIMRAFTAIPDIVNNNVLILFARHEFISYLCMHYGTELYLDSFFHHCVHHRPGAAGGHGRL